MVKVMVGLVRRADMSREQFEQWWLGQHAALARLIPNVRRIRFNLMAEGPFDGIAELWFDTQDAMVAGYASPAGERAAADSLANAQSRVRMPVIEHAILD